MIEDTPQDQGAATTENDAGTESVNNVPDSRLNQLVAQRNAGRDRIAELEAAVSKTNEAAKAKREEDLLAAQQHEVVISELKSELAVKTSEANEWTIFKSDKRKSLTEKLPESRRYIAEQIGDLNALDKFVEDELKMQNSGRMNESRPGQQPGGEFGGYGSHPEWAAKDPASYEKANNTVTGNGITIGYGPTDE